MSELLDAAIGLGARLAWLRAAVAAHEAHCPLCGAGNMGETAVPEAVFA